MVRFSWTMVSVFKERNLWKMRSGRGVSWNGLQLGIRCCWEMQRGGIFYRMCPWTLVVVRVLLFLKYTKERILIPFNGKFRLLTMKKKEKKRERVASQVPV